MPPLSADIADEDGAKYTEDEKEENEALDVHFIQKIILTSQAQTQAMAH
jgi:hypothetical protein